jgi:peptidoglycan/xylan/chitin deacetylase (PgdA/CDA1 family)
MRHDEPWASSQARWRAAVEPVRAGRTLRPDRWPGGARCAVALSFDSDRETDESSGGDRSLGRFSRAQFGARVGAPRILDLLGRLDVRATFFLPAAAALLDPDEPRRIAAEGHEIGVRGRVHELGARLDPAAERDLMMHTVDVIEKLAGERPVGMRALFSEPEPNTIAAAVETGLVYDSSMMADEDCYEIDIGGAPSGLVEVPVAWTRSDAAPSGGCCRHAAAVEPPPETTLDAFRREFDGAYDAGGLFQLVLHPYVTGCRSRIFVLEEIVRHAKARGDVWFGTHRDVAAWAKAEAV